MKMRNLLVGMAAVLLLVGLLAGCSGTPAREVETQAPAKAADKAQQARIAVDSLDDLPNHEYELSGTVLELLDNPAGMLDLRSMLRKDIESDLATYDIKDEATLQGMYGRLVTLNLMDGRDDEALRYLDMVRELEDKEAARLTNGLTTRSVIEAKRATGADIGDPAFTAAFREALARRVNALPWDVVQDQVKNMKGRSEFLNENLIRGVIQSQIEPAAQAMGGLSSDLAGSMVGMRYALDRVLPLNPVVGEVMSEYIAANNVAKVDIWAERDVVLKAEQSLQPVVIGIWDSGVDPDVFGEAMYVNKAEKLDGADTDGNGFVDDVHGIAFDLDGVANPHMLHPLGDQEGKLDQAFASMQGFQDLTSAIDSEAAAATRTKLGQMSPDEMGDFMTTMSFGGLYSHGTHVAGIAAAGNPFARLLVARITFDYHSTTKAMTVEVARRLAEDYRQTTRYFQQHGVRVVNMSWGWTFKEIEDALADNGVGRDAEERAAMAREMIGILSDGLREAMAQTPDILYVTAAGNDDNDVEFDVVIPSSFELPNLMVVGAVDQAGEPTGFTSGGRNVRVYANGFQVESFVPGGATMKMSGTSMASPNVCNLAAKLFTLEPGLTPVEVVELIEKGADAKEANPDILLINPKKTVGMLP